MHNFINDVTLTDDGHFVKDFFTVLSPNTGDQHLKIEQKR